MADYIVAGIAGTILAFGYYTSIRSFLASSGPCTRTDCPCGDDCQCGAACKCASVESSSGCAAGDNCKCGDDCKCNGDCQCDA
mmetsp:Transcript_948/g.2261  ORF Transcript_948/g.2261 Transcript_948/m.2261 type:complete len:83 (+) Transcript_948:64-312(+)